MEQWPWHEAEQSPPSSAVVKKYIELYICSSICLHVVMFTQAQRDNFTLFGMITYLIQTDTITCLCILVNTDLQLIHEQRITQIWNDVRQ